MKLTGHWDLLPSRVLGKKPVIGGLGLAQESTFPKLPSSNRKRRDLSPYVEDLIPPLNHLLGGYWSLDGG